MFLSNIFPRLSESFSGHWLLLWSFYTTINVVAILPLTEILLQNKCTPNENNIKHGITVFLYTLFTHCGNQ